MKSIKLSYRLWLEKKTYHFLTNQVRRSRCAAVWLACASTWCNHQWQRVTNNFPVLLQQILSAWGKISPSSRNAHVNVIIIINNALRFITVLWQLIGSSPSAHIIQMRSLLMSAAECREGAGGAMRVDGLQDGGRVNNTQLIALFLVHEKEEGKKKKKNVVTAQTLVSDLNIFVLNWQIAVSTCFKVLNQK